MKDKIRVIVDKLSELEPVREELDSEKEYRMTDGLLEYIDRLDKGCPVREYLSKLDDDTLKIVRLLFHLGKGNDRDLEKKLKDKANYEDGVKILKDHYDYMLKEGRDADIETIGDYKLYERLNRGYNMVFN